MRRVRFVGQIAGVGTTSGLRAVVGRWQSSPLGSFADVMIETVDGHRILLAPGEQIAEFVAATYSFDEVRIEPVVVEDLVAGPHTTGQPAGRAGWQVRTPSLELMLGLGRRTPLGMALRLVPSPLATSPSWSRVSDPVARVLMRGVRTRGTAGGGRTEYYGATDVRAVDALSGRFDGARLGSLARVDPPCRFGFSSAPKRPLVTDVVTTIDLPDAAT